MTGTENTREIVLSALGPRLRAVRRAYGAKVHHADMNMRAFARSLGVDSERYRLWESGKREMPLWMLLRIKHLTGISTDVILEGAKSLPNEEIFAPDIWAFRQMQQMACRIHWTRKERETDIEAWADLMRVRLDLWHDYELGITKVPMQTIADFAIRSGTTMDFLWYGKLAGVDPVLLVVLVEKHPELSLPETSLWPLQDSHREQSDDNSDPARRYRAAE